MVELEDFRELAGEKKERKKKGLVFIYRPIPLNLD